jgi:hypothetical protein
LWFQAESFALDLETVDDADGNGVPEVAVLSRRIGDQSLVVEIQNAAGDKNTSKLALPEGYAAADLTVFDDLDGNGIPEVGALLIRTSDGRFLVNTRNASGAAQSANYWFSP